MPKQKITKDMVVEAAFELAREGGLDKVTVKAIAEKLGSSVQPIYSYCNSMEGLREDVLKKTELFMKEYLQSHIDRTDFFRSTGYAYIQFAKEEPNIFQMFITHERKNVSSFEELYESETNPHVAEFIAENLKISIPKAKMLHRNMMIYTIGIGTILATTRPGISEAEVTEQLETAYLAFLKQVQEK